MVSVLASNSDDQSLIPISVYNFSAKLLLKRTKTNKKRPRISNLKKVFLNFPELIFSDLNFVLKFGHFLLRKSLALSLSCLHTFSCPSTCTYSLSLSLHHTLTLGNIFTHSLSLSDFWTICQIFCFNRETGHKAAAVVANFKASFCSNYYSSAFIFHFYLSLSFSLSPFARFWFSFYHPLSVADVTNKCFA